MSGATSLEGRSPGIRRGRRRLFLSIVFVGAVVICGAMLEGFLRVAESRRGSEEALVMPEEWKLENVKVPGAKWATMWHGHLHIYNRDFMRTKGAYPAKEEGVFRILALGDSLTYGIGVAAESSYPTVLDGLLGPDVEVLNMGVSGAHSEDVAELLRMQFEEVECIQVTGLSPELAAIAPPAPSRMCMRYELEPDLILYGVCLNDFLPSGVGQTARTDGWGWPIPGKQWLLEHSLAAQLIAERYDVALVKIGLRRDFFEEVEAGSTEFTERFARDVARMNALATDHGLPPVVGMVLQQHMGESPHLVAAAEEAMAAAGFTVIPASYLERHHGRILTVSRWEGHPNEEAHRIFAEEFRAALEQHPDLLRHRTDGRLAPGAGAS